MDLTVCRTLETGVDLPVTALAFSPSGDHFVAASQNGDLIVWRTRDWKIVLNFKCEKFIFNNIQFACDWKFFASGDYFLFEFDIVQYQFKRIEAGVSCFISPNGKILATTQVKEINFPLPKDDPFLMIGNIVPSNEFIEYKTGDLGNNLVYISTIDLQFSPNSSLLALSIELREEDMDWDNRLYLLPADKKFDLCSIHEASTHFKPLCFSPNNRYLAFGKWEDNSIEILRVREETELFGDFYGHEGRIQALTFSQDSKLLFSGSLDKSLRIWDIEQKNFLKHIMCYWEYPV